MVTKRKFVKLHTSNYFLGKRVEIQIIPNLFSWLKNRAKILPRQNTGDSPDIFSYFLVRLRYFVSFL